jgi:hypothetical protein
VTGAPSAIANASVNAANSDSDGIASKHHPGESAMSRALAVTGARPIAGDRAGAVMVATPARPSRHAGVCSSSDASELAAEPCG